MSFDLCVWYPQKRIGNKEASELYARLCDGDTSGVVPHPAIDASYAELTARLPVRARRQHRRDGMPRPDDSGEWRSSLHDGLYGFAGNLIRPGNLSSARFLGVQPGLVLDHIYSSHFSSTVGYFRFFTGDFLVQTPPGKNVGYLYAVLTSLF